MSERQKMISKRTKIVLGILSLCMIPYFATTALADEPPEPEVYPTSFNVYYGYHTSGVLSDVYTNNDIKMSFQQNSIALGIYFYFPQEKCEYLIFDFTDTATWPYLWVVSLKVYYTTGNPKVLLLNVGDGYYECNIDSSRYIDKVYVSMWYCIGQFLRIDQLIAMKY